MRDLKAGPASESTKMGWRRLLLSGTLFDGIRLALGHAVDDLDPAILRFPHAISVGTSRSRLPFAPKRDRRKSTHC